MIIVHCVYTHMYPQLYVMAIHIQHTPCTYMYLYTINSDLHMCVLWSCVSEPKGKQKKVELGEYTCQKPHTRITIAGINPEEV